jgi:mannitol-1-phosphate/altronate dehydrogenase
MTAGERFNLHQHQHQTAQIFKQSAEKLLVHAVSISAANLSRHTQQFIQQLRLLLQASCRALINHSAPL